MPVWITSSYNAQLYHITKQEKETIENLREKYAPFISQFPKLRKELNRYTTTLKLYKHMADIEAMITGYELKISQKTQKVMLATAFASYAEGAEWDTVVASGIWFAAFSASDLAKRREKRPSKNGAICNHYVEHACSLMNGNREFEETVQTAYDAYKLKQNLDVAIVLMYETITSMKEMFLKKEQQQVRQ